MGMGMCVCGGGEVVTLPAAEATARTVFISLADPVGGLFPI